ncbi:predicted protein [Plenodomus lingam JN3]|uniref:Predicted protein n=1 Tax=Leptosphaeria maculans (strain JN3 / isolate v23.1.3 / race Av1-4-5-6-7-8) TaxID=985895 RepID=E4ZTX8_LEPMJ|nr:predicted protein [Plenodomus lingam JN3]CBX94688.1 predicted protein [Plenodomus lingam JN3]
MLFVVSTPGLFDAVFNLVRIFRYRSRGITTTSNLDIGPKISRPLANYKIGESSLTVLNGVVFVARRHQSALRLWRG